MQPGKRGAAGASWAHSRVAIAYGEYLSADFHAWCLTVLDDFFHGRIAPAPIRLNISLDASKMNGPAGRECVPS